MPLVKKFCLIDSRASRKLELPGGTVVGNDHWESLLNKNQRIKVTFKKKKLNFFIFKKFLHYCVHRCYIVEDVNTWTLQTYRKSCSTAYSCWPDDPQNECAGDWHNVGCDTNNVRRQTQPSTWNHCHKFSYTLEILLLRHNKTYGRQCAFVVACRRHNWFLCSLVGDF
jgi:hypothetical protein